MKLHLIANHDEARPVMGHIHIAGGFAYVTDAHVLLRVSIEEIAFPGSRAPDKDWWAPHENRAIHYKEWVRMMRDWKDKPFMQVESTDEYKDFVGQMIGIMERGLPAIEAPTFMSFNPMLLERVMKATGFNGLGFRMAFIKTNMIRFIFADREVEGILMCLLGSNDADVMARLNGGSNPEVGAEAAEAQPEEEPNVEATLPEEKDAADDEQGEPVSSGVEWFIN